MRCLLIVWLLGTSSSATLAQSPITFQIAPIAHIANDRPGDFYVIDAHKKITKYNDTGDKIAASTLEKIPTLFDPWSGVRLFTYYSPTREIHYLDPTLSLTSILVIDSAFAIEPFLACPSGEYNYWLLDKADFSLKKILPRESKVQTEVLVGEFLSSPDNILHFREYLNHVFILDKEKGIIIFNQLGIKNIEIPAKTRTFGFYGEELYYMENKTLFFYDLYSGEIRTEALTEEFDALILLQEKRITIQDRKVKISDFKR